MRSGSEAQLSKEDQFAVNLAMAKRKETEAFKRTLTENIQLKMWCIEKGIEATQKEHLSKGNSDVSSDIAARAFFDFLITDNG